ncbi:M5C methyltransferase domain protein, partial [Vibrio parahaemolyticus EKP-021]
IRNPHD